MKRVKNKQYDLFRANNMEALAKLPDESVHVLISDVPYGMSGNPDSMAMLKAWSAGKDFKPKDKAGFAGEEWDAFVPQPSFWREAFRVLKPGGWCLSFFSMRTYDIGTLAMRVAGFEIHDQLLWMYGQTAPRSHRLDRSIDRRKGIDVKQFYSPTKGKNPQTKKAKQWAGWGTSLRPSCDSIAMTRKPLYKGSVVDNVLKYGVGALNIEGCRIPLRLDGLSYDKKYVESRVSIGTLTGAKPDEGKKKLQVLSEDGRFPTNLIIDAETGFIMDAMNPELEISRFFYHTKVGLLEREWGTEGLPAKRIAADDSTNMLTLRKTIDGSQREDMFVKNHHRTVKPVSLMRYLVRLVAPRNAVVLDPFMGSGSTGIAAMLEGCRFVGMEMDKAYFKIARSRISHTVKTIQIHPTERLNVLFG